VSHAFPPHYAELYCISNFSFLRGASHPDELVLEAAKLGYSALALTDECSLAGAMRAFTAARETQLPLILGSEFRLHNELRLVLLATDRTGYGNLCELISVARRRAPKGRYRLQLEDLERYGDHCLVIWPNAERCHAGVARDAAAWIQDHFAARAWIGASRRLDGVDTQRLQTLVALSRQTGLPLVACTGAHMHVRRRRALKDTLTAIRHGVRIQGAGYRLPANAERYLRSRTRLSRLYPRSLLDETLSVAERCRFSLDELRYEYPEELVPDGLSPASYLRQLTEAGLRVRWPQGAPGKIRALVEHELALICELHYEPYFLTVYDIVHFARSRNILCQGRGSAANSAVCYCLGITEVDPSRIETLFERFISRQRNEPPDIDVDFEHQRREEVIQYIYEKYGRDRAALAATVISYRPRSAVRDVGKALGLAPDQIDRLSQSIHWRDGREVAEQRLREAGFDPTNPLVRRLMRLVNELTGFPRHLSQHVGGFVIAREALNRMVPIENAAMPDRTVIQWDKDDLDALGLLKVDCLGLGMLSAIHRCFDLVHRHYGARLSLEKIPAEDPQIYAMISRADTMGVFQIESRAQMSMLPRLRPACFYDLVIEVAIVRPGPIQGNMVHPYLQRRRGLESVSYPSEVIRSVLERTLGIPIFQEQVIRLAVVAAGFTPGEADRLRRSMAAWRRHGQVLEFEQRLVDGMRERGYPETFARQLFKQILGFGEYGFPESHAASFALLVYVSAWLKYYYPTAFTCALLNSQPMGFYTPRQLVDDLRRHGSEVRPVDVTRSDWQCTLEPAVTQRASDQPVADSDGSHAGRRCALRLGLQMVKGLSRDGAARLMEARIQQSFRDVTDLTRRARLDRGDLEALAAANALVSLAGHRHQARWACAGIEPERPLLQDATVAETTPLLRAPGEGETLVADYASVGLSLGRHPLALLRSKLTGLGLCPARHILDCEHGSFTHTAGVVTARQSPDSASGTMFITLEDETGMTQVVVWPRLVQRQRGVLLRSRLLAVEGEIQREGEVIHLIASRLRDYSHMLGRLAIQSRDFH
jgi:error-prone DNA polymerase